jgi:hypothetical protein
MAHEGRPASLPLDRFDLDAVLHPGRVYAHPRDVVSHPGLTLQEKRAILSSWASDACAHRWLGDDRPGVTFDDVMDALTSLAPSPAATRTPRRRLVRLRFFPRRCSSDDRADSAAG